MSAPDGDRALLHGSEVEIFRLLSEGASPNQWAEWLRAPLEYAAAEGNFGLVTTLLGAGADGSAGWRGCEDRSLIAAAAHGGNEDVVQALLRAGGKDDLNAKFRLKEETALHVAAARGNEGAARALLVAGANLNTVDRIGRGALYKAAEEGHHLMVGDLLAHGACPNAKDDNEEASLHIAAEKGHALTVSTLLERGADKDILRCDGCTPLFLAVLNRHLGVAEQLLRAGVDPNVYPSESAYPVLPLHEAAYRGNLEMVMLLLRHGADATTVDEGGSTALVHASIREGDQAHIVCALLEAGAPVDARTPGGGHSALDFASRKRTADATAVVLALLHGGATVNCVSDDGRTPLHWACTKANVETVELLLRWGADETAFDNQGRTPPDMLGVRSDRPNDATKEHLLRRMLARAPADRAWRRRWWLVLCRYYPGRARLSHRGDFPEEGDRASTISSSSGPSKPTMAEKGGEAVGAVEWRGGAVGEGGGGTEATVGWQRLMARVVGWDVEDVFRTVVSFL